MKTYFKRFFLLFLFITLGVMGLFTGCGSDDSDSGSGSKQVCSISVYGGIGYSETYPENTTSVQFDVSFNSESDVTPLDIYVNSVKVEPYSSYGASVAYNYDLGEILDAGETIHISIAKEGWGSAEYDMVVCAAPDSGYLDAIVYSPSIDTLLGNLDNEDFSDTSLTVTIPDTQLTGCNNVSMFIAATGVSYSCQSVKDGNSFTFDLSGSNSNWTAIRDHLVLDRENATLYQTFEWSGEEYHLGEQCVIGTYYIGKQEWVGLSLPYDIEGTYNLTANYKAIGGSMSVTVQNYTSIITINRDFDQLSVSISGNTRASGDIWGGTVTLTGHILDSDSSFDGQTFY